MEYDRIVRVIAASFVLSCLACVSAPPPTAGMRETARNPQARVEGRVVDTAGRPVADLYVEAIPRGKDIPWSPRARTDSEGRFALSLAAPGQYGFVLSEEDRTVVTDDPRDPSRVVVDLEPGERRSDIQLIYLREERKNIR
jgi:Carboxypeptidase regulatory-like domain